jgi:hypothetical protein
VADIIATAVELVLGIVDNSRKKPEIRIFDCHAVERQTLRST